MAMTKEQEIKEIIRLKKYGYTYKEIAERLQIPEMTVRDLYEKNS